MMQEYNIVLAELIGGAIISLLLWYFKRCITNLDAKTAERAKAERDILSRITSLEEAIFELHNSLDQHLGREQDRIEIEEARNRDFIKVKDGIEAIIRIEISKSRRYFMDKGFIPPDEFENITQMFHSYEDLGGNGVTKKNYHDIENLPFEPPKSVANPT